MATAVALTNGSKPETHTQTLSSFGWLDVARVTMENGGGTTPTSYSETWMANPPPRYPFARKNNRVPNCAKLAHPGQAYKATQVK